MDPYEPIQGISLELYAELSADVTDHVNDKEQCARIVEARGIPRSAWDAAVAGWTARMQDMSLMGQVATRFMPLYQAALARKGPAATASYEDFVAMSAVLKAMGFEGMCATYGFSQAQWTQIAMHWNNTMAQNMAQFAGHHGLVEAEAQRLRSGGAPRPTPSVAGSAAAQAVFGSGSQVLVQWSDGNRYPGTVAQAGPGQSLVAFSDGRQVWVPHQFIAPK